MTSIKIFNTLSREKENFVPLKEKKAGMYVCGVTVYDEAHLGHARAYVAFDIIKRYLEYKGFKVTYVRNVTDIDDKIIEKAQKTAQNPQDIKNKVKEITEYYYASFIDNTDKLNVARPDFEPKATEHIPEIIAIIQRLLDKKLAYEAAGDVFFAVNNFNHYGKLSKKNMEDLIAGSRVDVNEKKGNPLDFVLWKKAKPNEPSWESPWGEGRPGWHIECSAMSTKYLGESFDIHGGGEDLIFPHHENEIAQSEGAFAKPFVKYWIHNGFVTINKEKMSKSLGNFFSLKDIFKQFEPRFVRLFLLSHKYRSPLDFSYEALKASQEALQRIDNCIGVIEAALEKNQPLKAVAEPDEESMKRFGEGMDDDFNTPAALAEIFMLVGDINSDLREESVTALTVKKLNSLKKICSILGIQYVPVEIKKIESEGAALSDIDLTKTAEKLLSRDLLSDEEIAMLIQIRNKARQQKNFTLADTIRTSCISKGIMFRDTKTGTQWTRS